MHDITNRYQVFPWIKQPGCGVITHPRMAPRLQMSSSSTSTCLLCLHRNVVGGALPVYDSLMCIHFHSCVIPDTLQIHMQCLWWMAVTNHHGRKLYCIVTHTICLALLPEHFVTKPVWCPQYPFMISAVLCVTFCVPMCEVCAEGSELQVHLPFKILWGPHETRYGLVDSLDRVAFRSVVTCFVVGQPLYVYWMTLRSAEDTLIWRRKL
jgi:hypothetical protein